MLSVANAYTSSDPGLVAVLTFDGFWDVLTLSREGIGFVVGLDLGLGCVFWGRPAWVLVVSELSSILINTSAGGGLYSVSGTSVFYSWVDNEGFCVL